MQFVFVMILSDYYVPLHTFYIAYIAYICTYLYFNYVSSPIIQFSFAGVSASSMLLEFCRLKQTHEFPHDTALLLTR